MAVDKNGRTLPSGITWVAKKKLYMGRFTYHKIPYTMYDKKLAGIKKKLSDKRYEVEHGLGHRAEKLTLNDWFEIWLNDYKINKIKPTTRQNYQGVYDCQIKNHLGEYYLLQIKPIHIQRMYNEMLSKGLSSKYLHNINAVLYNLMDVAVRNDLILKNPCLGVIKPPIQGIERRVLTMEEQTVFLRYIHQPLFQNYEPTLTILLSTGMRVGELLALTWDDINFREHTISITKTLVYVKDFRTKKFHFAYQTPKTKHGTRTIPLRPEVSLAFQRQRDLQNTYKTKSRWNPLPDFPHLVFSSQAGLPQQRGAVQKMLNRVVQVINDNELSLAKKEQREPVLMEHLHPHALRHSFATRCFEVDMPAKTVQMLLGHASIQMTLDLYTHVSDQKKWDDMSKLDNIFTVV